MINPKGFENLWGFHKMIFTAIPHEANGPTGLAKEVAVQLKFYL